MAIEQKDMSRESVSIHMTADKRICEMAANSTINVPVDPRIDIETITADDPDPKFVNVEVIRSGISGNNRRYNNRIVDEISDLVPGCQGFFGHPDPSKRSFEFREPQCIYVGSMTEMMPDGLKRCIAKAYLFKSSPLREWVPKSIAAGNPMTVSINGSADLMRNGDFLDLIHMTELESIDWANPGTEGMETSQAMSVVNEMKNHSKEDKEMADANVNAKEILQNATVAEIKAYNPSGYEGLVKGMTVMELQAHNPSLVQQIIDANRVTEMKFQIGGKEETVKVDEIQSKFDSYESKIAEMQEATKQAELDAYKSQKITEMVDEKHRDAFMKRVTGTTKEEIDKSLQSEIDFVREMGGMNNAPVGRNTQNLGSDDDMKAKVRAMFGVKTEDK